MQERLYWLGFSAFPGVGPRTFAKLLSYFGSAKAAWEGSARGLLEAGLGKVKTAQLEEFRLRFSIENYVRILLRKGVSFITVVEHSYPLLLAKIPNPPFVLYIKGEMFDQLNNPTIAIVGARKVTQYGREVTEMFTGELVGNDFTVVSGLAMGVDAIAHKTTIDHKGKTIAVLGCGVDCCSPEENTHLYDQILESGGAIVSEFPLGHPPSRGTFPSRNRIIAGLSEAVLVTEGAEDSGSLITADYAFKFGRKVFAVPGPITSQLSKGPYKLLEKGARLVTKGEDILKEFRISSVRQAQDKSQINTNKKIIKKRGDSKEEQRVLDELINESLRFDELVRRTKIPAEKLGTVLSLLEIKGQIKSIEMGMFSIT